MVLKGVPTAVGKTFDVFGHGTWLPMDQARHIRIDVFGNVDIVHGKVLGEQKVAGNIHCKCQRTDIGANRAKNGAKQEFRFCHKMDHLSQKMVPS